MTADRRELTWWGPWRDKRTPTLGQLVDEWGSGWWVCIEGDEGDADSAMPVFLNLARNDRGKLVCIGLVLGDLPAWRAGVREINAAVLRDIRLPELISMAVRSKEMPDEWGEAIGVRLDDLPTLPAGRPRPRWYGDDHFRAVADDYRVALQQQPAAPVKWLAERHHVSLPTVRRWIQRARDRGYLGASTPGKAGETEVTK